MTPDSPPEVQNLQVAEARALVRLDLQVLPQALSIRSKRFTGQAVHRPVLGEDSREYARSELIEEVSGMIRMFACKGSAKKLARAIEQARSTGDGEPALR